MIAFPVLSVIPVYEIMNFLIFKIPSISLMIPSSPTGLPLISISTKKGMLVAISWQPNFLMELFRISSYLRLVKEEMTEISLMSSTSLIFLLFRERSLFFWVRVTFFHVYLYAV